MSLHTLDLDRFSLGVEFTGPDGKRYIVTSVYRNGRAVATRIPDGDNALGLGRRYERVITQADIAERGLELFSYPSPETVQ